MKDKNGDSIPNYGQHYLADSAIVTAMREYVVAWDSIDVLLIFYAGTNPYGYSTVHSFNRDGVTLSYAITSERYGVAGEPEAFCFTYPQVIFHELLHAMIDAYDLHHRDRQPYRSGVGHYSVMGDNSALSSYTPPLLDPWHRLRAGWLRYYVPGASKDTLNLMSPLDTTGFHLPVVSELYNGAPPYVLVIPLTDKTHPDIHGWNTDERDYLIIENRRAVGWDSVIAMEELKRSSNTYGETRGYGGFLIWRSTKGPVPAFVLDADDGFETWRDVNIYGKPEDLFDGLAGRNLFSIWSEPNVFTFAHPGSDRGRFYINRAARNVYVKFAPYIDSSNTNPISRLVIDHFMPATHSYGETADHDDSPLKYASQNKIVQQDSLVYTVFNTKGKTYFAVGTDLNNLRDVRCVNYADNDDESYFDNSAIVVYSEPYLPNRKRIACVLQRNEGDQYYVVMKNFMYPLTSSPITKAWGPFQRPTRPSIAGREQFGVIAFAGDEGVLTSTTTNGGLEWSDPTIVPDSRPGSGHPCVLMDSEARGNNSYLIAFVDDTEAEENAIVLYSSSTQQVIKLSFDNNKYCQNPNLARLGDTLSIVYQNKVDKFLNNPVIGRIELDLSQLTPSSESEAFALIEKDQEANRDPAFIYADTTDARKSVLYWVYGEGKKLLSAANYQASQAPDGWFNGIEGGLSSKTTSYPHLFYQEVNNPTLLLARSGRSTGLELLPDTTPTVIVTTREQDLGANPGILRLDTQIGMNFLDGGGNPLMYAHWGTPVLLRAADTIAIVRYDYYATKGFLGVPLDTLTRTQTFEMTTDDVTVYALDLSVSQSAPDTLVIESLLIDPISNQRISSAGEVKIPPMTGDTTIYFGMELPQGYPPTECFVVTSMKRGYYAEGETPRPQLTRYMLYRPVSVPKRSYQPFQTVPRNKMLLVYPQPARDELRFIYDGSVAGTGRAELFDLLGRRVGVASLQYNGRSTYGTVQLRGLLPGIYMLAVPGENGVEVTKVMVTR